jgi:hypothetical protein
MHACGQYNTGKAMRDEYAQNAHRDEEPSAESFFRHACAERGPLEAAPGKARIEN